MNYLEELKQKENYLISLEAKVLAKKQSIEEMLAQRKKAEDEVKAQFGITLAEVSDELEKSKEKLQIIFDELSSEIEELDVEFSKIK